MEKTIYKRLNPKVKTKIPDASSLIQVNQYNFNKQNLALNSDVNAFLNILSKWKRKLKNYKHLIWIMFLLILFLVIMIFNPLSVNPTKWSNILWVWLTLFGGLCLKGQNMVVFQPIFSAIDFKQENNEYKIFCLEIKGWIYLLIFPTAHSFTNHKVFWQGNRVVPQSFCFRCREKQLCDQNCKCWHFLWFR